MRALAQVRRLYNVDGAAPEERIAYWRLLGHSLAQSGHLRRSAAAFRHMLRLMEWHEITPSPDDWGPLAALYRSLWRQTGRSYYYRHYLHFTCEATDAAQIALASAALERSARPAACAPGDGGSHGL
ncbi:MAG TPA: hypothetical protein VIL95_07690 [Bacillota bacterium]